ncbi:MAG: DUF4347 domain-containing protein [Nitrosomonadales bacterium]|nr:DUF4347 domain-containing protein [Nitrosomonadales bacterium]
MNYRCGQVNLGTAQLTQDALAQYQTQLATIGNALSDTGDLLLYGCNVAQGDAGQAFISALANATDADVAASTGLTGTTCISGEIERGLWDGYIERKLDMPIAIFSGHNAKKLTKELNYGAGSPSTNGG